MAAAHLSGWLLSESSLHCGSHCAAQSPNSVDKSQHILTPEQSKCMHTSKTIKPAQQGQSSNVWKIRSPCPEVYGVGKGELHQRFVLYPILHAERAEQFANAATRLVVDSPRDTDTEPTEGGIQYERSLQSMEWQSHLILEEKKQNTQRTSALIS